MEVLWSLFRVGVSSRSHSQNSVNLLHSCFGMVSSDVIGSGLATGTDKSTTVRFEVLLNFDWCIQVCDTIFTTSNHRRGKTKHKNRNSLVEKKTKQLFSFLRLQCSPSSNDKLNKILFVRAGQPPLKPSSTRQSTFLDTARDRKMQADLN